MARYVSGYVIRYDAPVGPPVWASARTSTSRARGVLHPHVRSEGAAQVFSSREAAEQEVQARPRADRATVVKVLRQRKVRRAVVAADGAPGGGR